MNQHHHAAYRAGGLVGWWAGSSILDTECMCEELIYELLTHKLM